MKNMLPGLPYSVQIDLVSTLQYFKVENEKDLEAILEITEMQMRTSVHQLLRC
ncbi:MAG: hypothetical protein IPG53_18705 [Ignavibacteriales bacterium]|nr:hypothetical protein [Ignavibacteriales bacterium]